MKTKDVCGRNANVSLWLRSVRNTWIAQHTPCRKTVLCHQRLIPWNFALGGHCPQTYQVATIPRSTTGYNQPLFFLLELVVKIKQFKLWTEQSCLGGTFQSWALVPALQLTDSTTTSDSSSPCARASSPIFASLFVMWGNWSQQMIFWVVTTKCLARAIAKLHQQFFLGNTEWQRTAIL